MANLSNINNKLLVGTNGEVRIGDTATVADVKLRIKQLDNQWPMQIVSNYAYGLSIDTSLGTDGNAGSLQIYPNSGGGFIVRNDSRVGIGETSPLGKLHVKTSDTGVTTPSAQGNLLVLEDSENGLSILSSTAGAGYINFGDSDDNDIGMIIYGHSSNSMDFWTNAGKRMVIDSSGRVGIGVTPSYANVPLHTKNIGGGNSFNIFEGIGNAWVFGENDDTGTKYCQVAGRYGHHSGINVDLVGKVGIGTVSPDTKLDVSGTIKNYATQSASTWLQGNGGGLNYGMDIFLTNDLGSTQGATRLRSAYAGFGTAGMPNFSISRSTTNQAYNSNPNTLTYSESLVIDGSSGNVGIGVTDPDAKLEIKATASTTGLTFKTTDAAGNENFFIQDGGRTGVRYYPLTVGQASGTSAASGARFQVATTAGDFVVLGTGNVGIGTTSPSSKLEIYSTATFNSRTSGINVHRPGSYGQYGSFSYNSDTTYFSSTYTGAGASYYGSFIWEQFNNGTTGRQAMRINTDGNVMIGAGSPTQKLDVAGLVKHQGLDMTAGIQVDQTTSISVSLSGAAGSWNETGIDGTDIGNSGSYMVQVYGNTQSAGASNYSMYWTGTMSWYAFGTNSGNTSEIYLNSAGHYRGMDLELRTISSANSATPPSMRIQFKSNQTLTGHAVVFKFRRLM